MPTNHLIDRAAQMACILILLLILLVASRQEECPNLAETPTSATGKDKPTAAYH